MFLNLITIDFTLFKVVFIVLAVLLGIILVLEMGKNKRFPFLGVLFFLALLALFAINEIGALASIKNTLLALLAGVVTFELAMVAVAGLFLLITFIIFLCKSAKIRREALEAERAMQEAKYVPVSEKMVYFTAKLNGKVKKVSKDFYRVFHEVRKPKKNWTKHVSELTVNGQNVPAKKFVKSLRGFGAELDVVIVLDNGRRINLPILKLQEEKHGKQVGYIYINVKESYLELEKEAAWQFAKQRMYNYINMLDEPVAFYDEANNTYVCSVKLCKLFEVEGPELTYGEYAERILGEDLNVFKTKMYNNLVNRYYYRVRTSQGYLWFEEKTLVLDGHEFIIVRNREKNPEFDLDAQTYVEMVSDIEAAYQQGTPFAATLVSFHNIPEINSRLEADNTEMLVYKFFEKLAKTLNTPKLKVYRFGEIEYGILFDNFEEYNFILRSLANTTSPLLKADVFYNDVRYSLHNRVGLVESKFMANENPEVMVKAALDSLDVATDPEYKSDFCIYFPPKPRTQVFNLDDYDINLDDSYLDNIYKK